MSDSTAQDNANKPLDYVDDLEDPNFDNKYLNGWEDDDAFAYDYSEHIVKHSLGSAKELEQMLRHKGLELRKKLQADLKEHPENWKALKRPASSLHSASLILPEMLIGIPHPDRDQFHELEMVMCTCLWRSWRNTSIQHCILCATCTRIQPRTFPEV
jgi:hypothetical protein